MVTYLTSNIDRCIGCRWGTAAALVVALCCGCAADSQSDKLSSWNPAALVGWNEGEQEKSAPKIPTRLVATWTETVLNKAGEPPKRGFGGRIAFFNVESEDPVRVNGQLVVYAFDETSRAPHETQPTRKYIFPAEEVVRHESESAVGPSYSFWLPWDEVGGPQKHISLIARFEPNGGPIVIGEQTKHFLPGAMPDPSQPELAQPSRTDVLNGVRLANYSQLAGGPNVPGLAEPAAGQGNETSVLANAEHMTTETIALPPRLAKAMQASARPQQKASILPSDAAANMPLSQLSTMRPSGPLGPSKQTVLDPKWEGEAPAEPNIAYPLVARQEPRPPDSMRDRTLEPQADSSATTQQPPSRSIAAGRPAEPGSLRDSLLGTLPARARQAEQQAPDHAR